MNTTTPGAYAAEVAALIAQRRIMADGSVRLRDSYGNSETVPADALLTVSTLFALPGRPVVFRDFDEYDDPFNLAQRRVWLDAADMFEDLDYPMAADALRFTATQADSDRMGPEPVDGATTADAVIICGLFGLVTWSYDYYSPGVTYSGAFYHLACVGAAGLLADKGADDVWPLSDDHIPDCDDTCGHCREFIKDPCADSGCETCIAMGLAECEGSEGCGPEWGHCDDCERQWEEIAAELVADTRAGCVPLLFADLTPNPAALIPA